MFITSAKHFSLVILLHSVIATLSEYADFVYQE